MLAHRVRRRPNIKPALGQWDNVASNVFPANTTRWPIAGLMLAQRRRRWANINPALGQCLIFDGSVFWTTRQ